MTWELTLRKSNTLLNFKRGLYFSSRAEETFKRMCKEGKSHIEKEIDKLNINIEVPHEFIEGETVNVLMAVTAGATGGPQAEDEMSSGGGLPEKYGKYRKDIRRIFTEGVEVCREAKKSKTATNKKESYIQLIKDIVEEKDLEDNFKRLDEEFNYDDFEKYIPLEDRTWKGKENYAWAFMFEATRSMNPLETNPPKMGETTKEYNRRMIDEGVYAF